MTDKPTGPLTAEQQLIEECGIILADEEISCGTKHQKTFAKLSELRDLLASRQSDRPATELTEAQVCKALGDAPALLASLDTEAITAALNAELRTAVLPPDERLTIETGNINSS